MLVSQPVREVPCSVGQAFEIDQALQYLAPIPTAHISQLDLEMLEQIRTVERAAEVSVGSLDHRPPFFHVLFAILKKGWPTLQKYLRAKQGNADDAPIFPPWRIMVCALAHALLMVGFDILNFVIVDSAADVRCEAEGVGHDEVGKLSRVRTGEWNGEREAMQRDRGSRLAQ